ncbi:MAG: hypothetical protein HGB28_03720, partial [Oscillochloris sp.]|nr:hypothetical protein [Oscillochloris sp.]
VMGLTLSAADIATLEARTEGWFAGLQLAALSMQGHQDVPGFIRAFAGDHRYMGRPFAALRVTGLVGFSRHHWPAGHVILSVTG